MLSVTVSVNGTPILTRSAVNGGDAGGRRCRYHVDDGSTVLHDPGDGAAALAVQLLGTIREPTRTGHKPPPR